MPKKEKNSFQYSIFDFSENVYKITKPNIRLIEFFAGIGFQRMGIEKAFPNKVESWKTCEWAIPSIIGYDAVHNGTLAQFDGSLTKEQLVDYLYNVGVSANYNEPAPLKQLKAMSYEKLGQIYASAKRNNNLINIMKVKGSDLNIIDTDKYTYVLTYSFPCQDLSNAGNQKGMSVSQAEGGTRSGLVWEILRILKECENKPDLLLMENVPMIHSQDNNGEFYKLQLELEKIGYKNFWEDMNACQYGIPQNRVRTFMLSILSKDSVFAFPETEPLKIYLKNMLEPNVDEKYYLSDKLIEFFTYNSDKQKQNGNGFKFEPKEKDQANIGKAITTRNGSRMDDNFLYDGCEQIVILNYYNHDQSNRVYSPDGCSPTLRTKSNNAGGIKIAENNKGGLKVKNNTELGYLIAQDGDGIDISTRKNHRGTVQKGMAQTINTLGKDGGVCVKDERKNKQNGSTNKKV